ncbi:hypothetical protein BRC75_06675 [Halobacteriales archaeon QH_7_69_31]|nr:MAG: hypothetical protein BRC75_06675 [Halobacteriales archaeon QH_7_69_31]
MGLSEIAAGLEVTSEQRDRGVATVGDPAAAAAVVEAYAEGADVGRAAAVAEVPPTTAAKALYLLGEPVDPLTPTARRVLADWLDGEIGLSEALTLANVGEGEFALGAYVATHEPIAAAESVVAEALSVEAEADPLDEARSGLGELV